MATRHWSVGGLVFGSGACALAYQVAWTRELRLLFGASTSASATTLALFIGGLGFGALWLGPRADRHRNPLALYARLEAAIAALVAVTPALLWAAKSAYLSAGGAEVLGNAGAAALRVLLAAPVLVPATLLMGGTLPAAARAVERLESPGRHRTASIYGLNTLGAVSGAFMTTFYLLERIGNRRALWLACAVNVAIAAVAWRLSRGRADEKDDVSSAPALAPPVPASSQRGLRTLVLCASAAVGFAFLLMEMVWYRMLAPLLGGTVFTMGMILTVALFGVGVGGLLYSKLYARRGVTLSAVACSTGLEALALAVPYALGDRIAIWAGLLHLRVHTDFVAQVGAWAAITSLVVLPAAVVSGVQFPMWIALLGRGRSAVGRDTGHAYASNTLGATLGTLAGGFGALSWLTAPGAWRAAVGVLLLTGAGAWVASIRTGARRLHVGLFAAMFLATALLLSVSNGPTAAWRHSGIGVGRVGASSLSRTNSVRDFVHRQRRSIIWEREGVESSVALKSQLGTAFVVNGKVDGHATLDAPTQVMSGLLGALLHGSPKSSLVIGLGTGSTAGWLARAPSIERVDVVELEPAITEVARACTLVNDGALENPKLHITLGDGREALLVSRSTYDLILSEPSNPYRAGISSLFTHEFYTGVRERLAHDGVFVQWMQAYEIDRAALSLVYATLSATFPHIETWRTHRDLLLVATRAPLHYSADSLAALAAAEPYRRGLLAAWRVADVESLFARYVGGAALTRALREEHAGPLNTDDRNRLEFEFARSLGRSSVTLGDVLALSRSVGADRLRASANVDWSRVDSARALLYQGEIAASGLEAAAGAQEGNKTLAALLDEAALVVEPTPERAQALAALLRPLAPVEAEVVLARGLFASGDAPGTLKALERAFTRFRSDPWASVPVTQRGLGLASALARSHRKLGPALTRILAQPFAMGAMHEPRLGTLFEITMELQLRECAEALTWFEPWVPWQRRFLEKRIACYASAGHPNLDRARRDLADFAAEERN